MATSESGMVSRLISAIRHSNRNSARMTTTRMNPITSAWVRLAIASLTKLACWNTLVSNVIPGSPGWSCRTASSTPAVICRLFAQGSFSTTSSSPGWPSMTASPISGWWSSATFATSPSRTEPVTGTLARSAGVMIGSTLRIPIRWFGVSIVPPVPITAPVENLSRPESTASDVASITFSSETCRACILVGSAWTVMSWSRSFQMATLATPGTRSSRARIVQYAVIDISMSEWFFDVMPICMARPVAETGASMTGGAAQVGRLGDTVAMRSCTSWRARIRSVPGLNSSSIEDSCGTDLDRMSSRPWMPFSPASSGTVTSCSTSEVDRPTQAVWMTTRGGANSGKTSTCICGSEVMPRIIRPAAAATIRYRNFRLEPMTARMRVHRARLAPEGASPPQRPGGSVDSGGDDPPAPRGSAPFILPR